MDSFDENGKYIKTNWKAGDKITATKLNKIEESIEAVNDNDISRHVETDARLDALEAKDVAHDEEFTNVRNLIADNKAAAELGDYEINSRITFLENELNEGIDEVHNVAETVDGKIATAQVNMTAQVNQGKADMEAMVAEVEADLEGLHAKDEELSEQLAHIEYKTKVYFEDFGAKGDGITDDTKAIQECITYCEDNGLIADGRNKTYMVSDIMGDNQNNTTLCARVDYGLYITKSLRIQNAKFKLKDGCPNYTSVINIYSIDGIVELHNLDIDGNRDNQTPHSGREDGGMHGVRHQGNRSKVFADLVVTNCNMHHCASDGMCIYTAEPIHKIVVRDSTFSYNRRNGVTDNSYNNSIFENCTFNNQIGGDENITGPYSGYHIEPDSYETYGIKQLINCSAYDNAGSGFKTDLGYGGAISIVFINCSTKNNGVYSYGISIVVRTISDGCKVKIDNCEIPDIMSLSTNSVTEKNNDTILKVTNSTVSTMILASPTVSIDECIIENTNIGWFKPDTTKIDRLIFDGCIFYKANAARPIQIDTTNEIKFVEIKNCLFNEEYPIASIEINNADTAIIKDCSFDTSSNNIRVYGSNKVYIFNNIFNQRGSWNYFLSTGEVTNLTYVNNILNNRTADGTQPSGGMNNFLDGITYKLENNIQVSYDQSN